MKKIIVSFLSNDYSKREKKLWKNIFHWQELESHVPAIYVSTDITEKIHRDTIYLGLNEREFNILYDWCQAFSKQEAAKGKDQNWIYWTRLYFFSMKWRVIKLFGGELDFSQSENFRNR